MRIEAAQPSMSRESQAVKRTASYGNWVSNRLIYIPCAIGLLFSAGIYWSAYLAVPAVLFLILGGYFAYARYLFAPDGGNVQVSVWNALLDHVEWDGHGKALDIGCGSGAVTILLAQKYPNANVTGMDSWGKQWGYSEARCESNATIEGVGDRVTFRQGSAASVPFPDESFDLVVSNLTFHEVKEARDKRQLLHEALRVTKKGGVFAFQDLFLLKRVYGDVGSLLATIRGWGVAKVEFVETRKSPFPRAVKLPFMIGTLGLIVGEK
jgi:SAM-dependent methyltransferase